MDVPQVFTMIPAVVDEEFLPNHPQELLTPVDFHPVPSIIDINNDEYGWLFPMVRHSSNSLEVPRLMLGSGRLIHSPHTLH